MYIRMVAHKLHMDIKMSLYVSTVRIAWLKRIEAQYLLWNIARLHFCFVHDAI